MKVFISGASGLVGGNCLNYFLQQKWECKGSHLSYPTQDTVYFDTLNLEAPENFNIQYFAPDVIVHCGALTHVDYCEDHIEESFQKTVESTKSLIAISQKINAKLVYISTDYVFDGEDGPYRECATVNPLSAYGRHKLEAENLVLKSNSNNLVLRVTNVYGKELRNKNFVARIVNQALNQEKILLRLPYDQYATPTNAWDIAHAMYLLLRDKKSGIYHISSTDYMNRVELAHRILKYLPNAKFELTAVNTLSLNQAAPRPLLGGLLHVKFSKEYPEFIFSTIDDFMQKYLK